MTDAIRKQYNDLKKKHPEALLLFRCGSFYEAYDSDADNCGLALGITVSRNIKDGTRFAGFPYHALDTYLPKLIRAGHRVAICDQLEEQTQKSVKRPKKDAIKPKGTIALPKLTKAQYELLCECVRYRAADNAKERSTAESRGMFTHWYDELEKELDELKRIIYHL